MPSSLTRGDKVQLELSIKSSWSKYQREPIEYITSIFFHYWLMDSFYVDLWHNVHMDYYLYYSDNIFFIFFFHSFYCEVVGVYFHYSARKLWTEMFWTGTICPEFCAECSRCHTQVEICLISISTVLFTQVG